MADDEEKTEEPTSKKIEDAKKEGNVGKSQKLLVQLYFFLAQFIYCFFQHFH